MLEVIDSLIKPENADFVCFPAKRLFLIPSLHCISGRGTMGQHFI